MATITKGRTFINGEVLTPGKLNALVDEATVTEIANADIASNAAIAAGKLAATLDLSSNTLTLPAGQALSRPVLTGVREARVNLGAASGTTTLNLHLGNVFDIKPTGSVTVAPSNAPASGTFVRIILIHGSASLITYTWPGTTYWSGGTAPTMNGIVVVSLFTVDGGSIWYGTILGENFS
jgi:hypothetical protein